MGADYFRGLSSGKVQERRLIRGELLEVIKKSTSINEILDFVKSL